MDYRLYEKHAAAYLRNDLYEVLVENYRRSRTQIDVVARKNSVLIVAEVKYRRHGGLPEELISHGQKERIHREIGPLMIKYHCNEWRLLLFFYRAKSFVPEIIALEC
jgi:Holliday junction resolvase-like predicted endonuclease